MNKWNLTRIYKDYDSNEYQEDFGLLQTQVDRMESIVKSFVSGVFDSALIEQYLKEDDRTEDIINMLYNYSMLIYSTDVSQSKPQEEIGKLYQFMPVLSSLDYEFTNYLFSVKNLEGLLFKTTFLTEHRFIILEKRNKKNHQLSEILNRFNDQVTLPIVRQLEQLYHQTYRSTTVSYKNKELRIDELEKLAKDDTKARQLLDNTLDKIEVPIATALVGIKKYGKEIATFKGFDSPLDLSVAQSRLNRSTLNNMFHVLDKSLPSFRMYLKQKANTFHKDHLSWDELYKVTTKNTKTYSIEETKEIITKALKQVKPEFETHAQKVFRNNWVDWENSPVKQQGAYCVYIRGIKESRILINFDGTVESILSLAHEIGHSYHGDVLFGETTSNSNLKLNTAETASILFESIVLEHILTTTKSTNQKIEILEYNLNMYIGVLLEVYSRFLFEKQVFKQLEKGPLSPEDLNQMMIDSIITVFGDSIDHKTIQEKAWITKQHYYNSSLHFYNWHYIFGLLFSKGIQASLTNKELTDTDFDNFLRNTGKKTTEELMLTVGNTQDTTSFWTKALSIIEDDINLYIESI